MGAASSSPPACLTHEDCNIEDIPPGPVLLLSVILDQITSERWRQLAPFGWCNEEDGFLRYRVPHVSTVLDKSKLTSFAEIRQTSSSFIDAVRTFATSDSTELGDLTSWPCLCIAIPILVLFLRGIKRIVLPKFRALGQWAGKRTYGEEEWARRSKSQERVVKFGEYVFRLIYHTFVSLWGLWYFFQSPYSDWFWKEDGGTVNFFQGYPFHRIECTVIWYYLVQCAYNVEALVNLAENSFEFRNPFAKQNQMGDGVSLRSLTHCVGWSKNKRGDFNEMAVHHVVTNCLVFFSSKFRFTRPGILVFLIHDISDVPVDLSKLANFLKWHRETAICFTIMVLVWLITRLTMLPYHVLRPILQESQVLIHDVPVSPLTFYSYYHVFVALVAAIIFLHFVWFVMFIKMAVLLVSKGEAHDLSEHKKGEKCYENGATDSKSGGSSKVSETKDVNKSKNA